MVGGSNTHPNPKIKEQPMDKLLENHHLNNGYLLLILKKFQNK